MKTITPEDFKKEMLRVRDTYYDQQDDEEICHIFMDDIICDLLISLGYEEGVEIFKNTPKWYS